jgi:hypothetical protein
VISGLRLYLSEVLTGSGGLWCSCALDARGIAEKGPPSGNLGRRESMSVMGLFWRVGSVLIPALGGRFVAGLYQAPDRGSLSHRGVSLSGRSCLLGGARRRDDR